MSFELSGFFIIELFLLTGLLFLPVPSSPYILYLFGTNSIMEAGIIFFLATTARDFITYYLGFFSRSVSVVQNIKSIPLLKTELGSRILRAVRQTTVFAKDKLKKATIRDVIIARWLGLHPLIVGFGLGRLVAKLRLFFVPNTFYVLVDICLYWIIFGSGNLVLNYFFPGFSIDSVLESENLYAYSLILIIIFYAIYGFLTWQRSKNQT